MNTYRQIATSQPFRVSGTGLIKAFSIFSGAVRAAARLANGFLQKASTVLAGTQLSRVILIGAAALSSERATFVSAVNPPYE
jgi:hypothetical protein